MVWIPKGIKDLLKRTRLYQRYTEERVCRNWTLSGKPIPPPEAVKHRIIRAYAKKFKTPIFIETGTYRGETLQAVGHAFRRAYSIELSPELFRAARKRFANCSRISLLEGDSGEVLSQILSTIHEPCLFWLDAHYCFRGTAKGEQYTPIRKELSHIFAHPLVLRHVILIDDARDFTGEDDYPTLETLENVARSTGFRQFESRDDIIRIHALT